MSGALRSSERDLLYEDIGELLEALGKPNVAMPESPHKVFRDAIAAVRHLRRMWQSAERDLTYLNEANDRLHDTLAQERGELERLQAVVDTMDQRACDLIEERDRLRAETEALHRENAGLRAETLVKEQLATECDRLRAAIKAAFNVLDEP